ncbi:MAG TPA: mechanosensitive ion channel family protein [Burkholderiaceae bacterium]
MDRISLLAWAGDTTLAGVSIASLALGVGAAVLAYLVMSLALRAALSRLALVAQRTTTPADDMLAEVLAGTRRWLIAIVALLVGVGMLDLPDRWSARVGQLWFIALALQIALWANRGVSIGLRRHALKHAATPTASVSAAATLVSWGLRTLLWAIVLLAMLSNLGVNITAFVASLGVGGIAVALAAQSVLGDLFASVAIAADKPFEVGDFIVLGSVAGTVELVGIKTTRIRSLGGEQIVMSNTELLKQTVSNYKRLRERRIVFGFGVGYDTSAGQAEEIPRIVRRLVEQSPRLRFDRAHFKGFGESSLDYEVVYIVLDPEYGVYMDEQQRINLALMHELGERGIGFAFPTRTLHVASLPERTRQKPPDEADAPSRRSAWPPQPPLARQR